MKRPPATPEQIRELRGKRTQQEFADLLEISTRLVKYLEAGERSWPAAKFEAYSLLLKKSKKRSPTSG